MIYIEVLVCKVNETSIVEVLTCFIDALLAMKQLVTSVSRLNKAEALINSQ